VVTFLFDDCLCIRSKVLAVSHPIVIALLWFGTDDDDEV
jgi:hypothetical protein